MNADLAGDGYCVVHRQMADRGDDGHGHRNTGRRAVNWRAAGEIDMQIVAVRLQVHRTQDGQHVLY
ncbi:hypothetical protein D3C74_480070 [compost metagenome]